MVEASARAADRHNTHSKVRLIAVVIAGLGVLAFAALLAISNHPWLLRGGHEYRAVFRSVAGLQPGDKVHYAGLEVGRVTSIVVDTGNPVRLVVTFRVRDDIPIHADTKASIPEINVPEARLVALTPGTGSAPRLPPRSLVPSEQSLTLQETVERAKALLGRADMLFQAARPLMERDFFGRLDRTMARADTLLMLASRSSARLLPQIEEVTRRTNTMLAYTNRALATLDSSNTDLAAAPREARAVLRDMHALLGEVRAALSREGGLTEMVQTLASAGDDLARLTARLERNPASVLQRRRVPEKAVGPKP